MNYLMVLVSIVCCGIAAGCAFDNISIGIFVYCILMCMLCIVDYSIERIKKIIKRY